MSNVIDLKQKRTEKRAKDRQKKYEEMTPVLKLVIGPILVSQGVIKEEGKENE